MKVGCSDCQAIADSYSSLLMLLETIHGARGGPQTNAHVCKHNRRAAQQKRKMIHP